MQYAEGLKEFIDICNKAMPPEFYTWSIRKQRELYENLASVFPYELPKTVCIKEIVFDINGSSAKVRTYTPDERIGKATIIYIRGGGFVLGSLDTHNTVCAELAEKSGLMVIALDFPLSPEASFPVALEKCNNLVNHLIAHKTELDINAEQIVLAGDSSGANMVVSICLMRRDRGEMKLKGQSLISPVLDFTRWQSGGDDAPLLTGGEMEFYTKCYSPNLKDTEGKYVSPLYADNYADLPPAYIMGAELDSLLIDSNRYHEALVSDGVYSEITVRKGLVHSAIRARGYSKDVMNAWNTFCVKTAELTNYMPELSNKVAIVDPYSSGIYYAEAFAKYGVSCIAIQTSTEPPDVYARMYIPDSFSQILIYKSLDQMVEKLSALDVQYILPGCESGVALADILTETLGLPTANVSSLKASRRNKYFMHLALRDNNVPSVPQIFTNDKRELIDFVDKYRSSDLDVILKPALSASTDGVYREKTRVGVCKRFDKLLNTTNRLGIVNDKILIQEYMAGSEYVVDTFTYDGDHHVSDVCLYKKRNEDVAVAVYETMTWVDKTDPNYYRLIDYAKNVLNSVGMKFGVAHIEIIITCNGPALVEIGTRPHGGGHPKYNKYATGTNQLESLASLICGKHKFGESTSNLLRAQQKVVFLYTEYEGLVLDCSCLQEIKKLETYIDSIVNIKKGSVLKRTTDLFSTLDLGFVVLNASNKNKIERDVNRIRKIQKRIVLNESLKIFEAEM